MNGFGVEALTEHLVAEGMTRTEVVAMFMGFVPNLFAMIAYTFILSQMGPELSDFCSRFRTIGIAMEKGMNFQVFYYVLSKILY